MKAGYAVSPKGLNHPRQGMGAGMRHEEGNEGGKTYMGNQNGT